MSEELDTNYRGDYNEKGEEWDGDFEAYIPHHWMRGYNVGYWSGESDTYLSCVLIGRAEYKIQEGEFQRLKREFSEDYSAIGLYVLENADRYRNPDYTDEDREDAKEREEMFRRLDNES